MTTPTEMLKGASQVKKKCAGASLMASGGNFEHFVKSQNLSYLVLFGLLKSVEYLQSYLVFFCNGSLQDPVARQKVSFVEYPSNNL